LLDVKNGGLVYRWLDPPPHPLESLPDIVKLDDLRIVPPDAELPPGHELAIGDEQRFGNLRVKVLRVTREPVLQEERDLLGAVTRTYPSDGPVLHLWLEFENVSGGQRFAPLDRVLLLSSGRTRTSGDEERSNQFVCRLDERHPGGDLVPPYWIGGSHYANQPFGEPLGPGETETLYVPSSEEGVEDLEGELVWRVQFRKGFGERSNKCLTTLVDVRFHSNEIEDRTAAGTPDA
jgi:hypothetical protein